MDVLRAMNPEGRPVRIYIPRSEHFGVSVFSERLADGFRSRGIVCLVRRVSFLGLFGGLRKDRSEGSVSILCLHLGVLAFLNPNSVYVLHGFPNRLDYQPWRHAIVAWTSRLAARLSRFVLANSGVTAAINSKFLGIQARGIWNPLREWPVLPELQSAPLFSGHRRQVVLFCGRTIPAKRAYEALMAFVASDLPPDWSFEVAGPLGDERLTSQRHRFVHHGTRSTEEVAQLMRRSRIFVTLNELEPYGLVIEEAARAGMVIVTCRTGGAAQELERQGYPRLVTVQQPTIDEVAEAYRTAIHL